MSVFDTSGQLEKRIANLELTVSILVVVIALILLVLFLPGFGRELAFVTLVLIGPSVLCICYCERHERVVPK